VTRFLVDNQLHAALAHWRQARGNQAEHVLAIGMGQPADALIWQHAAQTGAVSQRGLANVSRPDSIDFSEQVRTTKSRRHEVWRFASNPALRAFVVKCLSVAAPGKPKGSSREMLKS